MRQSQVTRNTLETKISVELNLDVVDFHSPYKGQKLHLSMDSNPYYVDDD